MVDVGNNSFLQTWAYIFLELYLLELRVSPIFTSEGPLSSPFSNKQGGKADY